MDEKKAREEQDRDMVVRLNRAMDVVQSGLRMSLAEGINPVMYPGFYQAVLEVDLRLTNEEGKAKHRESLRQWKDAAQSNLNYANEMKAKAEESDRVMKLLMMAITTSAFQLRRAQRQMKEGEFEKAEVMMAEAYQQVGPLAEGIKQADDALAEGIRLAEKVKKDAEAIDLPKRMACFGTENNLPECYECEVAGECDRVYKATLIEQPPEPSDPGPDDLDDWLANGEPECDECGVVGESKCVCVGF